MSRICLFVYVHCIQILSKCYSLSVIYSHIIDNGLWFTFVIQVQEEQVLDLGPNVYPEMHWVCVMDLLECFSPAL